MAVSIVQSYSQETHHLPLGFLWSISFHLTDSVCMEEHCSANGLYDSIVKLVNLNARVHGPVGTES